MNDIKAYTHERLQEINWYKDLRRFRDQQIAALPEKENEINEGLAVKYFKMPTIEDSVKAIKNAFADLEEFEKR